MLVELSRTAYVLKIELPCPQTPLSGLSGMKEGTCPATLRTGVGAAAAKRGAAGGSSPASPTPRRSPAATRPAHHPHAPGWGRPGRAPSATGRRDAASGDRPTTDIAARPRLRKGGGAERRAVRRTLTQGAPLPVMGDEPPCLLSQSQLSQSQNYDLPLCPTTTGNQGGGGDRWTQGCGQKGVLQPFGVVGGHV